nr:Lrp/AsnC ligand binding domain-containing protein [Candidatus Sigynarchaeota archaeon]
MVQQSIVAYILMQTSTRGPDDIVSFVKKQKIVKEAWIVYGDQDVIAKVEAPNFTEITKLIIALRKHPEMKRTKTLICSTE